MKFDKTPELLGIAITVAVVFSTFSVGAISANAAAPTPTPAETRYQQDRANCLAGKTAESQKTCLKEAGAALQAAREHDLKSPSDFSKTIGRICVQTASATLQVNTTGFTAHLVVIPSTAIGHVVVTAASAMLQGGTARQKLS